MKQNTLPDLGCACATIRRAARLVTQLYDAELRGMLEASQFALLAAIDQKPGCTQSVLARALGMDKTTFSRNLAVMKKRGWIEPSQSSDERERGFRLTAAGRKLLTAAAPRRRRAEQRLRSAMNAQQWESIWQALRAITDAAAFIRYKKGE